MNPPDPGRSRTRAHILTALIHVRDAIAASIDEYNNCVDVRMDLGRAERSLDDALHSLDYAQISPITQWGIANVRCIPTNDASDPCGEGSQPPHTPQNGAA